MTSNRTVAEERQRQLILDIHFLKVANLVSEHSKCLSRKIGAVAVKDNHIVSTGYNGPASGITHCEYRDSKGDYKPTKQSDICPRREMGYASGEGMEHCPAVHAEANVICQAARFGVSIEGSTLYCYCPVPCPNCAKELINAKIARIVCVEWTEAWKVGLKSKDMLRDAGVKVEVISEDRIWGKVQEI